MDARLRQQLFELHYDLLPEQEAEELRARLREDAEFAAEAAPVAEELRLVSLAARLEGPPLGLKVETIQAARQAPQVARRDGESKSAARAFARTSYWAWSLGAAAAVMLALSLGGYQFHRVRVARLDREYPRVVVAGPAALTPGAVNRISVTSSTVTGAPLPLNLVSTLYDVDRQAVAQVQRQETDANGHLTVEFTPKEDAATNYELRLARVQGNTQSPLARLPLAVGTSEFLTKVSTDRPSYSPGDQVFYRSLTLRRADLRPLGASPVQFRAEDLAGNAIAGSELQGLPDRGVGNGAFVLPADLPFGEYRLVAESPDGRFSPAEQRFFVAPPTNDAMAAEFFFAQSDYAPGEEVRARLKLKKSDGAPAADARVELEAIESGRRLWREEVQLDALGEADASFTLPPELKSRPTLSAVASLDDQQTFATAEVPVAIERVEASFYPEGGDLVAGVENRVYFRLTDQFDRPVDLTGSVVDDAQHAVGEAETKLAGRGQFRLTPQAGRSYRLRLPGVDDPAAWPSLPAVRADIALAMSVPRPVIGDDEALNVQVSDRRGGTAIVVTAHCRDRQVAQGTMVTKAGVNMLEVPLGADAGGALRVTLYDCSGESPRPVAERLVYRHDPNRLTVTLAGLKDGKYLPEEAVELKAQVTGESNQPAAGTVLAMSVFDDSLAAPRDASRVSDATFFELASQLNRPEDIAAMDLRLDTSSDAAVAIDLLLGTQGWRRFAELPATMIAQQPTDASKPGGPPSAEAAGLLLWDNLAEAQPRYERRAQELRSDQAQKLAMLMICGGLGLAVMLIMAALWRLVSSVELAIPSLAAAAGCVLLGVLLARSADSAGSAVATVAFAKSGAAPVSVAFNAPAAEVAADARLKEHEDRTEKRDAVGRRAVGKAMGDAAPSSPDGDRRIDKSYKEVEDAPPMAPVQTVAPPTPAPAADKAPQTDMPAPEAAVEATPPPRAMRGEFDDTKVETAAKQRGDVGAMTRARFQESNEPELRNAPGYSYSYVPEGRQQRERAQSRSRRTEELAEQAVDRSAPPESASMQASPAGPPAGKAGSPTPMLMRGAQEPAPAQESATREVFLVREYAHEPAAVLDAARLRAEPSLYWRPLAVADEEGVAHFDFYSGAGEATYRVRVDAHHVSGRLGAAEATFDVGFPIQLAQTLLPEGMTAGDRYDAPVDVQNSSNERQSLQMNTLGQVNAPETAKLSETVELKAQESKRLYLPFTAGEVAEKDVMLGIEGNTLTANDWKFSERVVQRLDVTSPGYPVTQTQAGWLRGETEAVIQVPENPEPGSLEVRAWFYPNVEADFAHARKALEELPQDNWNTQLALAYVDRRGVNADQFRVAQRGYGGFGGGGYGGRAAGADPQNFNRQLSLYWSYDANLYGNSPAANVAANRAGGAQRYASSMQRSSSSYGAQRGGDYPANTGGAAGRSAYGPSPYGPSPYGGGRMAAPGAADEGFGIAALAQAPPDVAATWALANQPGLTGTPVAVDLKGAEEYARKLQEPATTGVVANGLLAGGDTAGAGMLLDRLVSWQQADGRVENTAQAVAASGAAPSTVANTAVAALAWLKAANYQDAAAKAIDWLVRQRRGGGFGSADDTYLALRALEAHAASGLRPASSGELSVSLGGEVLAQSQYDSANPQLISLDAFAARLAPGENRLKLRNTSSEAIPYAIEVRYHSDQPQNAAALPVQLATSLSAEKAVPAQSMNLSVELLNRSAAPQDYIVAELGYPAGLEPNLEQLNQLRGQGAIDHFEVRPRTLIPYWRSLGPNETRRVDFELRAVAPGEFTSPASSVYRLAAPELRNWSAPLKVEVQRPAE